MASISFVAPFTATPNCNSVQTYSSFRTCNHRIVRFPVSPRPIRFASFQISQSHSSSSSTDEEEEEEGLVQDLRVPEQWLEPSKALEISQSHSSSSSTDEEEEEEGLVQDLRVPEQWLEPSKALEESEWLRVNLHKWLDDEYCPEPTNVEISNVAACSFYESLVQRQTDLGEILLKMARELESISYQESFHGAFSSANAAVNLIIQRLERD